MTRAPTPLALQMCPRSASRPSERSMPARATPASARPRATRGVGRWRRSRRKASEASPPAAGASASAAAASPSVPLTQMSSPGMAPARRRTRAGSTWPMAVTPSASGPRVVSPPTRATSWVSASAKKPSSIASHQAASGPGRVSASVHQAGAAPMAARSDRLTASAFQPMSAGGYAARKWTPSLSTSVVTTSSRPSPGRSTAASSPMPVTTSPRRRARRWMQAIRSNSMAGPGGGGPVLPSAAGGLHLDRAPLGGGAVEHPVDVGVAVLGAKALDGAQCLVDHHPVGHVDAVLQFVGSDAQHRALDLVDLLDAAVQERLQRGIEGGAMGQHPAHQVLEIFQVRDFVRLLVRELGDHFLRLAAGDLPGVDGLQRAPARTGAVDGIDAVGAPGPAHGSRPISSAISMATSAASSPLLPWLPPARRSASSASSTASTPLSTGTPVSSEARIRPSLQPSATCS